MFTRWKCFALSIDNIKASRIHTIANLSHLVLSQYYWLFCLPSVDKRNTIFVAINTWKWEKWFVSENIDEREINEEIVIVQYTQSGNTLRNTSQFISVSLNVWIHFIVIRIIFPWCCLNIAWLFLSISNGWYSQTYFIHIHNINRKWFQALKRSSLKNVVNITQIWRRLRFDKFLEFSTRCGE